MEFNVSAVANAAHALAGTIWVGGMFVLYVVLRPATATLPAPERLALWDGVLARYLPWLWAAVPILLVTGYWAIVADFGGFAHAPLHVHLMHGIGLAMIALLLALASAVARRFRAAVAERHWDQAGQVWERARVILAANVVLGLATVAIAASGRFWI